VIRIGPCPWKLVPLERNRTCLIARLRRRYLWEFPGAAISALALLEFGDFPMIRRFARDQGARRERRTCSGPENGARREG